VNRMKEEVCERSMADQRMRVDETYTAIKTAEAKILQRPQPVIIRCSHSIRKAGILGIEMIMNWDDCELGEL